MEMEHSRGGQPVGRARKKRGCGYISRIVRHLIVPLSIYASDGRVFRGKKGSQSHS